jgi:DNA-binding transcriptional regulator YhcF (GntR family)
MLSIDPSSGVPPYEQVRDQLHVRIESGELVPGTKLPTVRSLAADLGLAANTVARAYRDLETLGLIETRGRAGSVVSGAGVEQAARQAAHDYAERLRALGIGRDEGLRLVRQALDRR